MRVCVLALEGPSVLLLESGEGERVSLLGCSLLFLERKEEQMKCWQALIYEFSLVIDICTRQDRRVLHALLWLLIWVHNNNLLMAVKLLSQEL